MNFLLAITLVSCMVVSGLPAKDFPPFYPPGPDDLRSPCPALNALANHGFLPRHGMDVTINNLVFALETGLNVAAEVTEFVGNDALTTNPEPNATCFDLNMLAKHNFPLEHDGSLSRNDSYFGDDITFDHLVFDRFISQFAGYDLVPLSVVARARAESVLYASKQHPDFFFNASILNRSISESALYTSVLGDPITGGPKTGWIKVLFEEERLPYLEGWTPRKTELTLATLGALSQGILEATPTDIPLMF
ncbi:hypothetical protein MMC24_007628 [Lignoscripta atroalba]|nr:hypothetical protein [Lignoscripta atroalba]